MISLRRKSLPTSVLGLTLEGSRLEGVVVRRSNGSLQVGKTFQATLALDPLNGDPELVGREIRNHLEQAGIRERRCALCLPAGWAVVLHTEVPDLPEDDVPGFLDIEAERGFPYALDALARGASHGRGPAGKQFATQVGIPRNPLGQIERSLRAAQLRPLSFRLGVTTLQQPDVESSHGVLALVIGESTVDLQITGAGGVIILRALDSVFEAEGVQHHLSTELLLREIKITLGQLPAEFRGEVRRVRVFGRGEAARRFVAEAAARLQGLGLAIERAERYDAGEFRKTVPAGQEVSAAFSIAAQCVTGVPPQFEFLPPKVSPWQRLTARFSSRKVAWMAATGAAAALLIGGAFFVQQWQLSRLRREWAAMQPRVHELEEMQQQIRRFRPWFDNSFRNLTILRRITEAFPEDGVVSAKTLEIHERASVTCSGVANDNQALLKMLDQLRAGKVVRDLKVDNIRGKTPLQFTFNFQWSEGGQDGN
jgi:hypothetical protein